MAVLKIQLKGVQSMLLAAASVATSFALGAMMLRFAAGRQDLLVWCRDFVLARVGGDGPLAIVLSAATIVLASVSIGRVAAFLGGDLLRALRLRADVLRRRVATPGRVLAAAVGCGIDDDIDVVRDDVPSAFTFGLAKPRIIVTSALVGSLTRQELKAVIAHEQRHLRRRDPFRSLLWEAFSRAFFFLPALRDVASFTALRREVDADGDAESMAGRRALASALLKTVVPVLSPSSIAPFGHLHRRIQALAAPAAARSVEIPLHRIAVSAAVAAAILAANFIAVSPVRARDGTLPAQCGEEPTAKMSRVNFSPYLRIELAESRMSSAVQSASIAP